MRSKSRAKSRPVVGTRRSPAVNGRRLFHEPLESRRVLAQTTGLFFHQPEAEDGYVLFSPNTANKTFLIDKDGVIVNQWQSQYTPGLNAYLQPDGSLIRDAAIHGQGGNGSINAAGAGGLLERFDWNGTKNWQFAYDDATHLAHHDFEVLPNGNILLIAWELKTEQQATDAGRDPNLPGPGYMYPDHIVEVHPDYVNNGGSIVWQWHIWDHLVQEFDPAKTNYQGATGVEDHPELIDVNYTSAFDTGGGAPEDWTHSNGIDYNAQLDQIVLSSREFSEFWIIDHSTTTAQAASHSGGRSGKGGDLLYRWGNPQTYDRGTANDRILYYQHDPQFIPDGVPGAGHITVFNNGFGRPGTDFSQALEIELPAPDANGNYPLPAGGTYGPAAPVWSYSAPVENFSAIISGVQRLPNGNTLVDFGVMGKFVEVTPAGQEVWKYVNPFAGAVQLGPQDAIPNLGLTDPGLNTLLVNFTFQAIHYPLSYVKQLNSSVANRHLFYNQSVWDGNTPGIDFISDAAAIAPDKVAYLPGSGTATPANFTNYSRGINGLVIDLDGAGNHAVISASDFIFRVSDQSGVNANHPESWVAAPTPSQVQVSIGGGVNGSDRVEIVWNSGDIINRWLQIAIKANDQTGLPETLSPINGSAIGDLFFFGNRVGDGNGNFSTTNGDAGLALRNSGEASITNAFDYNRSGSVTPDDAGLALNSPGSLPKINLGGVVVLLEPGGGGGAASSEPLTSAGAAGIASALAAVWPTAVPLASSSAPTGSDGKAIDVRAATSVYRQLEEQQTEVAMAGQIDSPQQQLSNELLDALVASLAK